MHDINMQIERQFECTIFAEDNFYFALFYMYLNLTQYM